MAEPWKRLSVREGKRKEEEGLYEDVPDWLVVSLQTWVQTHLGGKIRGSTYGRPDRLQEIERRFRITLNWAHMASPLKHVLGFSQSDPNLFLDIVDFVLSSESSFASMETAENLERALSQGGSAWKVAPLGTGWCLERRVDARVAKLAEELMATKGRPAEHLRLAWHATYGRSPDPSAAYREAVRAVESAAKPVVAPNNTRATLGTMLGEIRSNKKQYAVSLSPTGIDPVDGLANMLSLLWTAQLDRHGTDDVSHPLTVSAEEAAAALHLAATLVHWFTSGAVRRI